MKNLMGPALMALALILAFTGPTAVIPRSVAPADVVTPSAMTPSANSSPAPEAGRDIVFEGTGFSARVDETGMTFGNRDVFLHLAAAVIDQGGRTVDCRDGAVSRPAPDLARIDRGVLVEEYRFETSRVEQLFVIPHPSESGPLRVRVDVRTNLNGPVVAVARHDKTWEDAVMRDGGLWFCDAAGEERIAYHGAVAFDAAGRSVDLEPRHDFGQIVLEVDGDFMAAARFPLTIDPWVEFGGSGTGRGIGIGSDSDAFGPSIAVDPDGNPVVAWSELVSGRWAIHLRKWDGSDWIELGSSATGGGVSGPSSSALLPSLALAPDGRPAVAWISLDPASGNFEIYLRQWNGSDWMDLGGSAVGTGISNTLGPSLYPSLAVDPAGRPAVAWGDYNLLTGNIEVYFRSWDGTAWVERNGSASAGGVSVSARASRHPSLALDSVGVPAIAWQEEMSDRTNQIYLRAWIGGRWTGVGGSDTGRGLSNAEALADLPSLGIDAGLPVVAWRAFQGSTSAVHLRRWDGLGWIELAGSATGEGIGSRLNIAAVALALNPGGDPVVAWQGTSETGLRQVFLKYWLNGKWVAPRRSASGEGISNAPGGVEDFSLAVDRIGRPVVAWDKTLAAGGIYVRGWR